MHACMRLTGFHSLDTSNLKPLDVAALPHSLYHAFPIKINTRNLIASFAF